MARTLSILSDNRTANPDRFGCTHGLSVLVRTLSAGILMDTGASGLFSVNAARMGLDLSDVDYVFLSHGHADHVGGLKTFLDLNSKAKILVSPWAVSGRFYSERGGLHSFESEDELTALAERLVTRYPLVSFLTGHCTGSESFRILQTVMGSRLQQFAGGMQIDMM